MAFWDDKDVLMDRVGPFSLSACVGKGMADACERDGTFVADDSTDGRMTWGSEACGPFSVRV